MKRHGHYCKVCGEYKANEKFSGKGHVAHICESSASFNGIGCESDMFRLISPQSYKLLKNKSL